MRLRNRIVKATWWTDPEVLSWSRDKRLFYQSLWALAEDSCCLEDNMFGVKLAAWPSPLDAEMSIERFELWRDELIAEGKLVSYGDGKKRYLYLPTMAEHERPRNPQKPDMPLPPWVKWKSSLSDSRKGTYEHDHFDMHRELQERCTSVEQDAYNAVTSVPVLPCPALYCPEQSLVQPVDQEPVDNSVSVDKSAVSS